MDSVFSSQIISFALPQTKPPTHTTITIRDAEKALSSSRSPLPTAPTGAMRAAPALLFGISCLILELPCRAAAHATQNENSSTQQHPIVYPTTVEIDAAFPRDGDSYAPLRFMPIVFAIQNSRAAGSLVAGVAYDIYRGDNYTDSVGGDWIDLEHYNFANATDPAFVVAYTPSLNNTVGSFTLSWTVQIFNCTVDAEGDVTFIGSDGGSNSTSFSIHPRAADITATGLSSVCPGSGLAYNVTGTRNSVNPYGTCPAVAAELAQPTPCAAQIVPSAAASIMAGLTDRLCYGLYPAPGCPKKSAAGRQGPGIYVGSAALAVVVVASFVLEPWL